MGAFHIFARVKPTLPNHSLWQNAAALPVPPCINYVTTPNLLPGLATKPNAKLSVKTPGGRLFQNLTHDGIGGNEQTFVIRRIAKAL